MVGNMFGILWKRVEPLPTTPFDRKTWGDTTSRICEVSNSENVIKPIILVNGSVNWEAIVGLLPRYCTE